MEDKGMEATGPNGTRKGRKEKDKKPAGGDGGVGREKIQGKWQPTLCTAVSMSVISVNLFSSSFSKSEPSWLPWTSEGNGKWIGARV